MDSEIQQYAGDILAHPRFQQLRTFCHHGLDNSVYDHSVAVAEAACQIARLMRLSESETASVVRAALLHEISRLDEVSCGHLLKYIRLMRNTEQ